MSVTNFAKKKKLVLGGRGGINIFLLSRKYLKAESNLIAMLLKLNKILENAKRYLVPTGDL